MIVLENEIEINIPYIPVNIKTELQSTPYLIWKGRSICKMHVISSSSTLDNGIEILQPSPCGLTKHFSIHLLKWNEVSQNIIIFLNESNRLIPFRLQRLFISYNFFRSNLIDKLFKSQRHYSHWPVSRNSCNLIQYLFKSLRVELKITYMYLGEFCIFKFFVYLLNISHLVSHKK